MIHQEVCSIFLFRLKIIIRDFCQIIGNEIKREIAEISEIIKGNNAIHIDLGKVYAQSAGVIFLESLY